MRDKDLYELAIPLSDFGCFRKETPIQMIKRIIDDGWLPYLRPMSSMTEEEKKEFKEQFGFELDIDENWGHSLLWNTGSSDGYIDVEFELDNIDLVSVWLDEKMFDWRRIKKDNKRISMIKAGLAIEAPKGMYN